MDDKQLKQLKKLALLQSEPMTALFDELVGLREDIKAQEKVEVEVMPSETEKEMLKCMQEMRDKPVPEMDMSKVENLLQQILTKEKEPDEITVVLEIV